MSVEGWSDPTCADCGKGLEQPAYVDEEGRWFCGGCAKAAQRRDRQRSVDPLDRMSRRPRRRGR